MTYMYMYTEHDSNVRVTRHPGAFVQQLLPVEKQ